MFQLANISRPVIGHEQLLGPGREIHRASIFVLKNREEMLRQGEDVLSALTQRRELDLEDLQPVVEIFPKALLLNGGGERPVAGGNDAQIDASSNGRTQAINGFLLQGTQDLRLGIETHAIDIIEKERPSVRLLELAGLAPGIDPGDVMASLAAKELELQQALLDSRTVDLNKRTGSPHRAVVHRPGQEPLTRAALAAEQNSRIETGHPLDPALDLLHLRTDANETILLVQDGLQLDVLIANLLIEFLFFHRQADQVAENVGEVEILLREGSLPAPVIDVENSIDLLGLEQRQAHGAGDLQLLETA